MLSTAHNVLDELLRARWGATVHNVWDELRARWGETAHNIWDELRAWWVCSDSGECDLRVCSDSGECDLRVCRDSGECVVVCRDDVGWDEDCRVRMGCA